MKLNTVKPTIWYDHETKTWSSLHTFVFPHDMLTAMNVFHEKTPYSHIRRIIGDNI